MEEKIPNITKLWENSRLYYNNNFPGENPYISFRSWYGVQVAIFPTNLIPSLPYYVPENIHDAKLILESKHSKLFYCELCAFDSRRFIQVQGVCRGTNSKKTTRKPNPGYVMPEGFTYHKIDWILASPLRRIYTNHLLLYTANHISGFGLFENEGMFYSLMKVLDNFTLNDSATKMIFTGNYNSMQNFELPESHFFVHVTNQRASFMDQFDGNFVGQTDWNNYNLVKGLFCSDPDINKVFSFCQKLSRWCMSRPEYQNGSKYLSFAFKTNRINYVAFALTGITAGFTIIGPYCLANITNTKPSDIDERMKGIQERLATIGYYEILPNLSEENPLLSNNSIQYIETHLNFDDKNTGQAAVNNFDLIKKCSKEFKGCDRFDTELLSIFLTAYIKRKAQLEALNTSSPDFPVNYVKMIQGSSQLKDLVIEYGWAYFRDKEYSAFTGDLPQYLRGSLGSMIFQEPFQDYLSLTSNDDFLGKKIGFNFYDMSRNINSWVREYKELFGDPSSYGYVLKSQTVANLSIDTSSYDLPEPFVIKINKEAHTEEIFIYECINGFVINDIRKMIPHFFITFGGFKCNNKNTAPLKAGFKGNFSLCDGKNGLSMIAVEFIEGKTLGQYMLKADDTDTFYAIIQVIFALYYAQRDYRFTHYDLHASNVLVHTLSNQSCYKYIIGTKEYSIPAKVNSCIIDLGWSRVKDVKYSEDVYDITNANAGLPLPTVKRPFLTYIDLYIIGMHSFTHYCSKKDAKSVENLKNYKQNPLAMFFKLIWTSYRGSAFFSGCKTFEETIDEIVRLKIRGSGSAGYDAIRACTKIHKDNVLHNLPIQHEGPIKGSPYESPIALITFFEDILHYVPSSTEYVYTWGDVDQSVIGCEIPPRITVDEKLVAAAEKIFQNKIDLEEKAKEQKLALEKEQKLALEKEQKLALEKEQKLALEKEPSKKKKTKKSIGMEIEEPVPYKKVTFVSDVSSGTTGTNVIAPSLPNIGNSCFYGSVAQLIFRMNDFVNFLIKQENSRDLSNNLKTYATLFKAMRNGNITAQQLQEIIPKSCPFSGKEQEDASELLNAILDKDNFYVDPKTLPYIVNLTKEFYTDKKCTVKSSIKDVEELTTTINVTVKGSGYEVNINSLIYEGCSQIHVELGTQLNYNINYETYGNYVIVCLNRFTSPEYKDWTLINPSYKNNRKVLLEDTVNFYKNGIFHPYKLVGFVAHQGISINSGHYISFINYGNKWYIYNDDKIISDVNKDDYKKYGVREVDREIKVDNPVFARGKVIMQNPPQMYIDLFTNKLDTKKTSIIKMNLEFTPVILLYEST
jgi:hypothetical protein